MHKTYTVKQAAKILGYSTNSIYTFLKTKRIKGVRVGRGRFRIPEEELARVMHLSRKTMPAAGNEAFIPVAQGDAGLTEQDTEPVINRKIEVLLPNIFDWFIGLAAVVSGTGLFLFNSITAASGVVIDENMFVIVRVMLIACGFGILMSSIISESKVWNRVFHLLIALIWGICAYGFILSGDYDGVMMYGGLSIVTVIHFLLRLGGIVSLMSYVTFLAVAIPGVMIAFPWDTHAHLLSEMVQLPPLIIGLISLVVSVLLLSLFWVGYWGNHTLYICMSWVLALCDVLAAAWYAQSQNWSRAFFLVILGNFTALLPYWWQIQQETARRYRILLHGLFGGIGVVLLSAIVVVFLLQQNVWDQRQQEFDTDITVAKNTIIAAMTSVKGSLAVVVKNADFVRAMEKGDPATLTVFGKVLYESNPNIRRLLYLDSEGDGIAMYPYGTFSEDNLSYRDYFREAKSTGLPYISDVFLGQTKEMNKYVVVVSAPVYGATGEFIGVLTASVDLARIGLQLSEIVSAARNESFVIADAKGTILIHPDETYIGTVAPKGDLIYTALSGTKGVKEGKTVEGITSLIAFASIPDMRWAVLLRVPLFDAYLLTSQSIWIIFGVSGCMVMVSAMLFTLIRQRIAQKKQDGS